MRYKMIDALRGLTIISMVLYHTVWDLINIFNWIEDDNLEQYLYVWQQSICWSFIFLSGFCSQLGHRQIKRGIEISIWGFIITAVTFLFTPKIAIFFGVLTFLGSAMLLTAILSSLLKKIPTVLGLTASLLLFTLLRNINKGFLGFEPWNLSPLPEQLYEGIFATYLGFTDKNFASSDYFSLLPWLFLFLSGYFCCRFCQENNLMPFLQKHLSAMLECLGQHSLKIYLLHQPAIYLILLGLQYITFD